MQAAGRSSGPWPGRGGAVPRGKNLVKVHHEALVAEQQPVPRREPPQELRVDGPRLRVDLLDVVMYEVHPLALAQRLAPEQNVGRRQADLEGLAHVPLGHAVRGEVAVQLDDPQDAAASGPQRSKCTGPRSL